MECIQLNLLSEKHMKEKQKVRSRRSDLEKVRGRQTSISINYCAELSKTVFPCEYCLDCSIVYVAVPPIW